MLFRKWANSVLKDYLLRGYAINHRFERIEQNIQERFQKYDDILQDHQNKIDSLFWTMTYITLELRSKIWGNNGLRL